MLGLSFDTKSNVSVFTMYLNARIVFTFYVGLLHTRSSIHITHGHVNPRVLLFAAFCACKINPRKTHFSIFNGSQTLILSNLIQF